MKTGAIMIEPDDVQYGAVFDTNYGAIAIAGESPDALEAFCKDVGVDEFDPEKVQRIRITQRRQ